MIIGLSCLPFKWHGLLCLAILPLSRVVCTLLDLVPCSSQLALHRCKCMSCVFAQCWCSMHTCILKILKILPFFCKCAEVCELRMRYRDLFEGMFKTLRAFASSSSEFILFLACHHSSITDFEINAFLNQDSYRLLKLVSDLVSIFDTG